MLNDRDLFYNWHLFDDRDFFVDRYLFDMVVMDSVDVMGNVDSDAGKKRFNSNKMNIAKMRACAKWMDMPLTTPSDMVEGSE